MVLKTLNMCVYHALFAWFALRSPEGKNVNLLYSDTTLKMDEVRQKVLKIHFCVRLKAKRKLCELNASKILYILLFTKLC